MKLTIVIHSLAGGGAERICCTLASQWSHQGNEVCVVTIADSASDMYALPQGLRRVELGLDQPSRSPVRAILANLARVRALRRELSATPSEAVVSMMTATNVLTLLATRGLGIPVVVSERTHPPMYPLGRFWETLRRWTYPWAHRVVMLTQDGLDWLEQAVPRARGVVIPNPVSLPLPLSEPMLQPVDFVPPQRRLLLAAGRMDEGKQFDRLISAFHSLHEELSDWDLVILGDGPLRPSLQSQINAAGLGQRAFLPGRAGNIGQWYQRADLYALTSRFEGFPNVLIEAMAHGCPVVSYDCDTGPRDIVQHGINGLLVRPVGDVHALQQALRLLMRDTQRRQAMANHASEVLSRFALGRTLALWKDALPKLGLAPADAS